MVHYAKWSPAYDRFCGDSARGIRIYCHPKYFEGLPNTLYHNRGDGTFEDVTARAGLMSHAGPRHERVFCGLRSGRFS